MNRAYLVGCALLLLVSCGSSSTGGGESPAARNVITLAATGTLSPGVLIGGIDVTVTLPDGVTVQAAPDTVNPQVLVPEPGVVTASGTATGSIITSVYTAATASVPASLRTIVINTNGFPAGEFAVVNIDIAAGANPAADDVLVADFAAVDGSGTPLTGLTAAAVLTTR